MRTLTYDIYTKDGAFIENVSSFKKAQEAKKNGYTIKERMIEMVERLFFDCYKGDELVKTVTLNKEREEMVKNGYTVKPRLAWIEG